jgi:hypothetical protein
MRRGIGWRMGSGRRIGVGAGLLLLGGWGVLMMAAGTARAEETGLRYTLDPMGPPSVFTAGQAMVASDAPLQEVKLPRLRSKKPLFLTAKLGNGADPTFTFVLDETEPGGGYDLLYADCNHNRDLRDDPPSRLTRWRWQKGFKPLPLLIEVDGNRTLYHAAVAVQEGGRSSEYRLQSWAYYSGEARFGEKSYPVALVDANGNGLFNDPFRGFEGAQAGDLLLMDTDGTGNFEPTPEFISPKMRYCARRLQVDGRYYDLNIRPDGSALTVAPTTARLATLQSDYSQFSLILASADGWLAVKSDKGTAQVPVGDYRLVGWQIEQRDREGNTWVTQGNRYQGADEAPAFPVLGDRPLPRLGSPLTAKLEVDRNGGREFEYRLNFTGASGETIGEITRNGQRMPEPRVRILDAAGREVANLPFHYG